MVSKNGYVTVQKNLIFGVSFFISLILFYFSTFEKFNIKEIKQYN